MPKNGKLDARDRAVSLDRLADTEFDVLVIGGGITGAGAALDAASRGLRVALVEARDLASGTSSRSSKLIHGGLRYLEQFDFKLVWEALRERDLLVSKLAPHLVKPVSFLYPLHRKVLERPYVGAGLVLYDAMEGTKRPVPHHRHMTVRGALRLAPGLKPSGLAGALLYYDAQTDDARYTVTVARTAAAHGALIANRVSAQQLLRDDDGRVVGARVHDEETGREVPGAGVPGTLFVRGASTATGYWARYDASRLVFQGEWLRTGDTYVRDADGYYACLGRTGDMIKASGIWVSPMEVEARLLAHPAVAQSHVIGVPDERMGEVGCAWVVPAAGAEVTVADVPDGSDSSLLFDRTVLPW